MNKTIWRNFWKCELKSSGDIQPKYNLNFCFFPTQEDSGVAEYMLVIQAENHLGGMLYTITMILYYDSKITGLVIEGVCCRGHNQ